MYTEEKARVMAESKHYYQTADQRALDSLDYRLLNRPWTLSEAEQDLCADRIQKLCVTGCLRVGMDAQGRPTYGKTSMVKRKKIQRW